MAIRSYHHGQFDAHELAAAKRGRSAAVVIPARNEEATIHKIVAAIRTNLVDATGLVDEVLVVDDRSTDATGEVSLAAGARVVRTAEVLPELTPVPGKGEALWKGVAASRGDLLAFVDGDLEDFDHRFVVGLLGPLLTEADGPEVSFVKAFYERPIDGHPRGGGRVTELAARPILTILHPHLASVVQPLAGEFAAPRHVLESVPFVHGYGVDIGLLVDVAARFGPHTLAQVDLGRRVHRNRPIDELGPMATEVLLTALDRAGVAVPDEVTLQMPDVRPRTLGLSQRPPLREVLAGRGAPLPNGT